MADITKQSYEEFRIHADFGLNMATGESLSVGDCDVKCWDKDDTEVTDTLLDIATKTIVTGDAVADGGSGKDNAGLQVLIKGGTEAQSPYKFTFYGVTDKSPPHKWEKDITMRIRER